MRTLLVDRSGVSCSMCSKSSITTILGSEIERKRKPCSTIATQIMKCQHIVYYAISTPLDSAADIDCKFTHVHTRLKSASNQTVHSVKVLTCCPPESLTRSDFAAYIKCESFAIADSRLLILIVFADNLLIRKHPPHFAQSITKTHKPSHSYQH